VRVASWAVSITAALASCSVVSGCGRSNAAGSASGSASSAQRETAACSKVLSPWTQYIADSNDFGGWVATVGAKSPVVALPQNAARVFLAEQAEAGTKAASADGFAELARSCATFAASDPAFDFHNLPTAPALSTN
jgi:hypothetical protein